MFQPNTHSPAPIQAQLFNNFQRPIHTNHGQFITNPTPTQSHSADAVPIWASSPPPIQRPSCTASLSVQVMQHQPRTCIHQCIETESRLAQQWQRFPQSRTIRCQFHAIYEDICLDNLGYLDKCPRKWHRIGTGLARIGMDWQGLAKIHRKIDLGLA